MIRNIAGKTAKRNYFIIQGAGISFNQKDKEKCRNLWFYVIYGTMFPKAEAEFVQTFCRFLKYEIGFMIDGDAGMAQAGVSKRGSAGSCPVDHDCRELFIPEGFPAKG